MVDKKNELLRLIPSVDEVLKSQRVAELLRKYSRNLVVRSIRECLQSRREDIISGKPYDLSIDGISLSVERRIEKLHRLSLRGVINATGIIIHTNLGRSLLPKKAIEHILSTSSTYTNLEYDLMSGKRGKRYSHVVGILKELTGCEDALVVNNNAAAVMLSLNTIAKGREVIISRGELVEIGGSFRIPDVMLSSGALLREVGTTNKTRIEDYERAINENTALLLKVHRSNFRISGFTEDVAIGDLVELGRRYKLPVMFDLGSGSMVELERYGIRGEPSVKSIVNKGVDLLTFSGDKLLGGPQAGIILGRMDYIKGLQKNPLTRVVRIDKLTLSGLEATLTLYRDEELAIREIPTLSMLLQPIDDIKNRAERLYRGIREHIGKHILSVEVKEDVAMAGGGSLPEVQFKTYIVSLKPYGIPVNEFATLLR
ncbi:MAG: L-seryl-tRNA(Sec) selenium transferase, partial [Nitrospirae bacterium]